jgi:hypothetical protein
VGKGSERRLFESIMNSAESSYHKGEMVEVDQRIILIIGGIEIFLPSSPIGARSCVAGEAIEGQPTETIKEEKEQTLMSTPTKKEDNSDEFLTQWEQELNMLEDWLENPKLEYDCQKIVTKIVREDHSTKFLKNFIREAKQRMNATLKHVAEEGVELYPEEQLIEYGDMPSQEELIETNMSKEESEQQFSKETAEFKSATEWKTSATRANEDNMRDQVDLPIDKYGEEEVQRRILHKKS